MMNGIFDSAPIEVQNATIEASQKFKAMRHAQVQKELWTKEAELRTREHDTASKRHLDIIARWDGGSKITPVLEELEKKK